MFDKWTKVKEICLYFHCLRDLLGEQLNLSNHCVTNNAEDLPDIDDMMTQKGSDPDPRTPDTSGSDEDKGTKEEKEEEKAAIEKDEIKCFLKYDFAIV